MQEPHRRHRFNPCVGKVPWSSGNPLQFCCLENSMDRGGWWAIVHRVAKSWTQLKWLNTYTAQFVYLLFSHSFQTSSPQPKTSTSYQTSLKDPSLQLPSSLSPFHETTQRMFYTIGCQHLFPFFCLSDLAFVFLSILINQDPTRPKNEHLQWFATKKYIMWGSWLDGWWSNWETRQRMVRFLRCPQLEAIPHMEWRDEVKMVLSDLGLEMTLEARLLGWLACPEGAEAMEGIQPMYCQTCIHSREVKQKHPTSMFPLSFNLSPISTIG